MFEILVDNTVKEKNKKEDEEKSGEISSGGRAGAGKGRPSPVVFVFCDLLLFSRLLGSTKSSSQKEKYLIFSGTITFFNYIWN